MKKYFIYKYMKVQKKNQYTSIYFVICLVGQPKIVNTHVNIRIPIQVYVIPIQVLQYSNITVKHYRHRNAPQNLEFL